MKKLFFAALANIILLPLFSFAGNNAIRIDGMTCGSCITQITTIICKDKEMGAWFDSCSAEVTNAEEMTGQLSYKLKKNITLDVEKKKKIEAAVEKTGRKVLGYN